MTSTAAITELCPGCFADKGLVNVCPHCGYNESLKRGPLVLPHRTLLHQGQYLIGKVLGKPGGFGITYLALDTKLETRVAIKEYLPRDLAGRDGDHATVSAHSSEDGDFFRYGLTQFLQEARTLARFDHANIVRVRNFFEENGTGYLVMDYYDGITLADYLAQQPQGKLPENTAVDILMPILDGLREVHAKNFLHRDIKPQNIYLTTGNRAILLDFGAARQAMSERSRSVSVVLSEGYAPYEQYHRRGEQGPWTDIYACAAVLYHAVAGQAPPPATERMSKDELDIAALAVSASLANALQLGLATDHHNRPQTMTELQALLLGKSGQDRAAAVEPDRKKVALHNHVEFAIPTPIEPVDSKITSSRKVKAFVTLTAVIILSVVVSVATREEKKKVPTAEATPAAMIDVAPMPTFPASKSSSNPLASAATKMLEDQLTCISQPEPGKVIRRLLAIGLLRITDNGSDGIAVLAPTTDIFAYGKKVKYVSGWEMALHGSAIEPFYRVPGTPPPFFIAVSLDANPGDVHYTQQYTESRFNGRVWMSPRSSIEKSNEPYDQTGTTISCYGDQFGASASTDMSSREDARAPQPFQEPAMVRIPGKNYEIGKYEVTQAEWRTVMGKNPSGFQSCGDTCPVERLSWNEIQVFLGKLNRKTGRQYRLPTDAEWEFACRAGSKHDYCGSDVIGSVAWYEGNSGDATHPVGLKLDNRFGLFDMSGNVWEWVNDCSNESCSAHVKRGGSWRSKASIPQADRPWDRFESGATYRLLDTGFRLARSLP